MTPFTPDQQDHRAQKNNVACAKSTLGVTPQRSFGGITPGEDLGLGAGLQHEMLTAVVSCGSEHQVSLLTRMEDHAQR